MKRWILPILVCFLVAPLVAMATGNLAVPINFGSYTAGVHNLSDFDTNFSAVSSYINNREITQDVQANRPAAAVKGRYYFATDTQALYADTGSSWTTVAQKPLYTDMLTGMNTFAQTVTQVFVGAGVAASDDTNVNDRIPMTLASATQGNTAGTWVAGNFQNKLDAGVFATGTWHIFVIERTDTGNVDILLSQSATNPTMPTNYTKKRRVASVLADATPNFRSWIQDGDFFQLAPPVLAISVNNPGAAAVTGTAWAPTGINTVCLQNVHLSSTAGAGNSIYFSDLSNVDSAPTAGAGASNLGNPLASLGVAANVAGQQSINNIGQVWVRCNTSAQYRYRLALSDGNTYVDITTVGWIDRRGKG